MQAAPAEQALMIEEAPLQKSGDLPAIVMCIVAILIFAFNGIFFWVSHPLMIFSDQGLYMHMAQLFLRGHVPYVEMFEINPPLAIYLHILPVKAARLFHITLPMAFSLYIWSLIFLSSILSAIAVWRSGSRGALYMGIAAILGLVYYSQLSTQILDFGQRDHMFAILYFPFFIVRYLHWQGLKVDRWVAVTAGIIAGAGIALKHYFVLVALAPEIVWCIDRRAIAPFFRTETVAAVLTMLLYALHFLFLPKAELDTFFGFIVPIYQAGYSYYMTSLSYNLIISRNELYAMCITTLGALVLARRSSFVLPLQAFSLMSFVIFVLAGQVWTCHTVEIRLASAMACFAQAFLLVRYLPSFTKWSKIGPILLGLAVVAFGLYNVYTHIEETLHDREAGEGFFVPSLGRSIIVPTNDIDPFTRIVNDHTTPGDYILFVSSAMAPGYPVFLQSERRPASRFLHGMIVPILGSIIDEQHGADVDLFKERMQQVFDWYKEDIAKNKPKLIFVQIRFMSDLLSKNDFYANEMANYRVIQELGDYRVYMRND